MEWLDKMNAALAYIEDNLTGTIDYEILAQRACCSSYNFQRMFSFITDIPVAEYIRRRRLTQAGLALRQGRLKVMDAAQLYGYESATAFARAFTALHGISPGKARGAGVTLRAFPKISFHISIKGEESMMYRIERRDGFTIFGREIICSLRGEGLTPAQFWQQCHADGTYEKLFADAGSAPAPRADRQTALCRIHAAEYYRQTGPDTFPYMLCAFAGPDNRMDGWDTVQIPSQTYAVFPSPAFKWEDMGPVFHTLQRRFHSEWLPAAQYERDEGPSFEIYGGNETEGYVELWYPIRPIS